MGIVTTRFKRGAISGWMLIHSIHIYSKIVLSIKPVVAYDINVFKKVFANTFLLSCVSPEKTNLLFQKKALTTLAKNAIALANV